MSAEWQPVIAAIAAMIVALTPAVVALVQAYANKAKLQMLQDGQKETMDRVASVLENQAVRSGENKASLAAIHARLDKLNAPPGYVGSGDGSQGHT